MDNIKNIVKTDKFSIDFYAIIDGEIHFFATLWRDYENIHLTNYRHATIPVKAFVDRFESEDIGCTDNIMANAQQTEDDNVSEDDAVEIFNTFFNGVEPEGELAYEDIVMSTPDGNYFTQVI